MVVVRHEDFDGDNGRPIEFYAHPRSFKIITEGPPEQYFQDAVDEQRPRHNRGGGHAARPGDDDKEPNPEIMRMHNLTRLDNDAIALARNFVETDDDNEPAPENVPLPSIHTENIFAENWGHGGIDFRGAEGIRNVCAGINSGSVSSLTTQQLFELMMPMEFTKSVVIPKMNEKLLHPINYSEFLKFLGVWLLMATIEGPQRQDFWSLKKVDIFTGTPFRLTDYMSHNRFDHILQAPRYTNSPAPTYKDPFHEVHDLINPWNKNMADNFTPSWISCLDESMSTWTNKYTCLGFMFVPRKPWPFGNEYHTICCGQSGIIYGIELVKGKDEPRRRPPKEFDDMGKTVGLLLRLTKPLWHTGKIVVLDSRFCIVKGIVELKKKGVYLVALIKKRRYWPKYIRGDVINFHFADKEVGSVDAWAENLDNIPFHVFGMKEPDYTMMLMSTYGTCNRVGEEKKRSWKEGRQKKDAQFKYPEVLYNHYTYCHCVDDHNAKRHQPISLEVMWATKWWPNRPFAFIVGISEVNAKATDEYFNGKKHDGMLAFWKKLAYDLLHNTHFTEEDDSPRKSKRRAIAVCHNFEMLPAFRKFRGADIVKSESKYPQAQSNSCKKRQEHSVPAPKEHICARDVTWNML